MSKKTTGRYETREELLHEVWLRYLATASNCTDIAKATRVSQATVLNIIDSKEGYAEDYQKWVKERLKKQGITV